METKIILERTLAQMPEYLEAEKQLTRKGFSQESIRHTANSEEPFVFFLKKGKKAYASNCPNYSGYLLDGVYGGVVCAATDVPLPRLVYSVYCQKKCEDCPLAVEKGSQQT